MAVVLALTKLFDDVAARLAAEAAPDPAVPQVFGWRKPSKAAGAPVGTWRRLVWVPGDDKSGDVGELEPPKQPGRNPRPLATIGELVTIYVEAADLTDPENERAQYQAARELLDALLRCVHRAAPGTYEVLSMKWLNDNANERRQGAAVRVLMSIEAMVPDRALSTIGVGARAEWTSEVSGNTETTSTTDPSP